MTTGRARTGLILTLMLAGTANVPADWRDYLSRDLGGLLGQAETQSLVSRLSETEVIKGLKEALAQGVETAITSLGRTDGFLGNDLVRIAMPQELDTLAQAARAVGGDAYVDAFITTMNRAAEKAVPEAAEIFANAIRQMSIEDAKQILTGSNDAATRYFRRVTEPELIERFRPIVANATENTGVTAAYKRMVRKVGPLLSMLGQPGATDLDGYVTDKAMDGLFTLIAQQEEQIREDPAARTTALLKRVFASVDRGTTE